MWNSSFNCHFFSPDDLPGLVYPGPPKYNTISLFCFDYKTINFFAWNMERRNFKSKDVWQRPGCRDSWCIACRVYRESRTRVWFRESRWSRCAHSIINTIYRRTKAFKKSISARVQYTRALICNIYIYYIRVRFMIYCVMF